VPVSDFSPTIEQLGALMRSRTIEDGSETGTFTSETRPTADEAAIAIKTAADDVAIAIGSDIPLAAWDGARVLVAYRAAMLIEITYYPEQIGNGSMYEQWKEMFDEGLLRLIERVQAIEAGEGDPDTTLSPGMAEFYFPPTTIMEW
jgi:hypothetical protein